MICGITMYGNTRSMVIAYIFESCSDDNVFSCGGTTVQDKIYMYL